MISGTGYALSAMVCYGLGDFIYKRAAAAGVPAHHFLMAQAWCFAPAVFLYAWATDTLDVTAAAAWGALAGLLIFISFFNFLRSLTTGSVSINAPIFRLSFIITAVLAIVILHEPVTIAKGIALLFALVAIWLLLGSSLGGSERRIGEINRRSIIQVLIATAALGAANFSHTLGLRHGSSPETLLASQAAVFVTLSTAFVRMADGSLKLSPETWRHAVPAAAVLIAAFLFMLHSLIGGPASVFVPIAQMGFVVAAGLGVVLLREPMTIEKALGLMSALVALAFLASR
jgi:drug/metabolite transporter (DMT)-like permease